MGEVLPWPLQCRSTKMPRLSQKCGAFWRTQSMKWFSFRESFKQTFKRSQNQTETFAQIAGWSPYKRSANGQSVKLKMCRCFATRSDTKCREKFLQNMRWKSTFRKWRRSRSSRVCDQETDNGSVLDLILSSNASLQVKDFSTECKELLQAVSSFGFPWDIIKTEISLDLC